MYKMLNNKCSPFFWQFFDGGDGGGGEHFWHVKSACSDRKVLYLPVSQVVCGVLGKLFFLKLPVSSKFMTQTGDVCLYIYKYAYVYAHCMYTNSTIMTKTWTILLNKEDKGWVINEKCIILLCKYHRQNHNWDILCCITDMGMIGGNGRSGSRQILHLVAI